MSPTSTRTRAPCRSHSQRRFRSTPGRDRLSKMITTLPSESSRSRDVRADEPGAAGDQRRTCRRVAAVCPPVTSRSSHTVSPLAASSWRAVPTRSIRLLPAEPLRKLDEPVLQRHLRPVAEPLVGQRDVGEAVADVADAVLRGDLRLDLVEPERGGHARGHVADREVLARAHVEGAVRRGLAPSARASTRARRRTRSRNRAAAARPRRSPAAAG